MLKIFPPTYVFTIKSCHIFQIMYSLRNWSSVYNVSLPNTGELTIDSNLRQQINESLDLLIIAVVFILLSSLKALFEFTRECRNNILSRQRIRTLSV